MNLDHWQGSPRHSRELTQEYLVYKCEKESSVVTPRGTGPYPKQRANRHKLKPCKCPNLIKVRMNWDALHRIYSARHAAVHARHLLACMPKVSARLSPYIAKAYTDIQS